MSERQAVTRHAAVARSLLRAVTLALLGMGFVHSALAHDARPLSIALVEQSEDVYRVVVRAPPTVERDNAPAVAWPAACELLESAPLNPGPGSISLIRCTGGIEGRTLAIRYPAYNPSITTLVRLEPAAGPPTTAVLPPDRLTWTVPPEPTLASVARDYVLLGVEHIWGGVDHLLFVAGLLLLAGSGRRIVLAVTGFTIAHSITLSLAALGVVRAPVAPVEAMIALSILFLAAEIARRDATSFSHRFPIALSFVFGLLHGFGFASALGEIGLPQREIAAGLLFFNVGVELGQLAFIALVVAATLATRALLPGNSALPSGNGADWRQGPLPARLELAGAYCLGVPAAFWFLERTAVAFSS